MVNRFFFLLILTCIGCEWFSANQAIAQGNCPASTICPKPTLLAARTPVGVKCEIIKNPQNKNLYLLKATAASCDCKYIVPTNNGIFKMDCSTLGSPCFTAPNSQGACYGEMTVQAGCPGCSSTEVNGKKRAIPFLVAGDRELCNSWMEAKCDQVCGATKAPPAAVPSIQCVGTKSIATPTPKPNTPTTQTNTPTPQPSATSTPNTPPKTVYLTVDLVGATALGLVDMQISDKPKNWVTPCGANCITFAPPGKARLTATPSTGYYFKKWESGGTNPCSDNDTNPVCEFSITTDKNIRAHFGKSYTVNWLSDDPKKGKVPFPASPAGIPESTCGTNCKVYQEGDVINFNAEPSSGWSFFGSWSGDCTSTIGKICVVDTNKYPTKKNLTIIPNFVSNNATPTPVPTATPTPTVEYAHSELTVYPAAAITVTTAKANMTCLKQPSDPNARCYRIRLSDKVTLTAQPSMPGAPEKTFSYYDLGQDKTVSDPLYSFNMELDKYISAKYVSKTGSPQQCLTYGSDTECQKDKINCVWLGARCAIVRKECSTIKIKIACTASASCMWYPNGVCN